MPHLPKNLTAFIWHFATRCRWYFIGMMITGLIMGITTSLGPYYLKLIIDDLSLFTGDKSLLFNAIKGPSFIFLTTILISAVNFRVTDWLVLKALPNMRRDIIVSMFRYLKQHSHQYFQNNFAGSLLNKIMDMQSGVISIMQKLDQCFAQFCTLFVAIIALFLVHISFGIILFFWSIAFVMTSLKFTKKIREKSHVFSESKTKTASSIVDSISNVINTRLFAGHRFETDRITTVVSDTVEKDQAMQRYILKMRIYQDICILVLMTAMLFGLIVMYQKNLVTIGDFAFVLTVSISIFQSMWFIASQFVQFAEDMGQCSQALSIINQTYDINDHPQAYPLTVTRGEIRFNEINFGYSGKKLIFENMNFIIEAGTKVGLVGFSGSGKTTCVNLILRLYDTQAGQITIDGQNITEVTQDSLHQSIAMIPQDINLFHRSLMENIRYGRLDASDNEVIEASKQAHCHEFISELPEGYDTLVGERGVKLSGGQRQRIAIARALLKKAPILILDEATSALDSVTEKYIQEALHTLMHSCTTIVIAHRLSTLAEMDRIIVFDRGKIIEDGSHNMLLDKGGHYAKMWEMQAGGFLPEFKEF